MFFFTSAIDDRIQDRIQLSKFHYTILLRSRKHNLRLAPMRYAVTVLAAFPTKLEVSARICGIEMGVDSISEREGGGV